MGRPFGSPGDPAFQTRVLRATLDLLETKAGPIIADFPDDAPAAADGDLEGWACPVSFGQPADEDDDGIGAVLQREIGHLAPWYDLAVERRRRTTVGISGFEMEEAADYVLTFLDEPPETSPREDLTPGDLLKLACDDLKAFYFEAITAQPGAAGGQELEDWFWNETSLAEVFMSLKPICLASDDESMRGMGLHTLVPRNLTESFVDPDL